MCTFQTVEQTVVYTNILRKHFDLAIFQNTFEIILRQFKNRFTKGGLFGI